MQGGMGRGTELSLFCFGRCFGSTLHIASILFTAVQSSPASFHKSAVEGSFANAPVHFVVYTAHPLLQIMPRGYIWRIISA